MDDTLETPILPGRILGVLGSGQLGRMFAQAAIRMGYRVRVYSPDEAAPAAMVGADHVRGDYDDTAALKRFYDSVDGLTVEFENIPSAALQLAAESVPVRPGAHVLETTQNRLREKQFLSRHGFPCTPYAEVSSRAVLAEALNRFSGAGILKTAAWGYDGKGQVLIESSRDADEVWATMQGQPLVLEAKVDLAAELSVIIARGEDGTMRTYEPFWNEHTHHILDVTTTSSTHGSSVRRPALQIARGIAEQLQCVGVLCVEMFLSRSGELLINELAPRPHNSGHLTIEAFATSQFEQQVRALCGLPLGDISPLRPAAMANLLGDLWQHGDPCWHKALRHPGVSLHLYGKTDPRPGRKMGHLTAIASTSEAAAALVRRARHDLAPLVHAD